MISLAFLDLNSYDSTLQALDKIYERIVPSGVIAFWQLENKEIQAEGSVYNDFMNGKKVMVLNNLIIFISEIINQWH